MKILFFQGEDHERTLSAAIEQNATHDDPTTVFKSMTITNVDYDGINFSDNPNEQHMTLYTDTGFYLTMTVAELKQLLDAALAPRTPQADNNI